MNQNDNKKVDFRMKFTFNIPRWYPITKILIALRNYCFEHNITLHIDDYGGILVKTYYIVLTKNCTIKEGKTIERDVRGWINRLQNL